MLKLSLKKAVREQFNQYMVEQGWDGSCHFECYESENEPDSETKVQNSLVRCRSLAR